MIKVPKKIALLISIVCGVCFVYIMAGVQFDNLNSTNEILKAFALPMSFLISGVSFLMLYISKLKQEDNSSKK